MLFRKKENIFCVSVQRTGTTSVGQFFKEHNYKVASYNKKRSTRWSKFRFLGNYDAIFKSTEFRKFQVFEDNPWYEGEFYKILYHRFPNAKFILLTRDADQWYNSMMSHSQEKTLGNTLMHCKMYRREEEYYQKFPDYPHYQNLLKIDNLLELNESHREHYLSVYQRRNKEVIDFFNAVSPTSLFTCRLEDPKKWLKLADFFNIKIADSYEVHANKTKTK